MIDLLLAHRFIFSVVVMLTAILVLAVVACVTIIATHEDPSFSLVTSWKDVRFLASEWKHSLTGRTRGPSPIRGIADYLYVQSGFYELMAYKTWYPETYEKMNP